MVKSNQSEAEIVAAVNAAEQQMRATAVTPPPPFRDERPAPMSDGARTMREAGAKHARKGTGPLVP